MIGAIQSVNFKGNEDLINAPGKFTSEPKIADMPNDSFEKKSNNAAVAAGIGAVALLATALGLGYAVSKGHIKINKIEKAEIEGMTSTWDKYWAKTKNLGNSALEQLGNLYNNTLGKLFGSASKKAEGAVEEAAESAEGAAERAAEAVAE